MVAKDRFFEEPVQRFLGLLHDPRFQRMVPNGLEGYDLSMTGKMVFPPKAAPAKENHKEVV
jgi:hypothetical protein